MSIKSYVKSLCTPAYVYLMISLISLVLIVFQNAGNTNKYCIGNYTCDVANTSSILVGHGLYILVWTIILNMICNIGYTNISWFILLLPFILGFIFIGIFLFDTTSPHLFLK